MTDDEYLALVRRKRDSLNLKQKALSKIGLDEDELQEIPPIMFEGFTFKNAWSKRRAMVLVWLLLTNHHVRYQRT